MQGAADIFACQLLIAEEIIPVHDLIELLPEKAVLIDRHNGLLRYMRRIRYMLDSQTEDDPTEGGGYEINGVSPFSKVEEGTKDEDKNDGEQCAGSRQYHRNRVDLSVAVLEP